MTSGQQHTPKEQYSHQELLELINNYRAKFQAYNLSIHLYDSEHTNYYTISEFKHQHITYETKEKYDYLIVLLHNDHTNRETITYPQKTSNIYFCSTTNETQMILDFILMNPETYTPAPATDDVYNNAHMLSLDAHR